MKIMKVEAVEFFAPPGGELSAVKVDTPRIASRTFGKYFQGLVYTDGSRLKHPSLSKNTYPTVQKLEMKFRVEKGKWTSFGFLALRFYSKSKLQVRAKLAFQAKPFGRFPQMSDKCEISWHLHETNTVLSALLIAISDMDWQPLRDTGLFTVPQNGFSERPDHGCYAWTAKGWQAESADSLV